MNKYDLPNCYNRMINDKLLLKTKIGSNEYDKLI